MPKRIPANDLRRLNLANIVQRLPLHQQLSEANITAIKLTPIWQRWSKSHLAIEFRDQVQLSCTSANTLVLTCPHAICASQLKHRQENLLSYIQNSEEPGIERIEIRVAKSFSADLNYSDDQNNDHLNMPQSKTQPVQRNEEDISVKRKVASNSVQSIEYCQQTIANPRLAESLAQLATTLKNQSGAKKDD